MHTYRAAVLSGLCCRMRQCLSVAILFSIYIATASASLLNTVVHVEVFCIDECVIGGQRTIQINNKSIEIADLQVYALGHIQRIEVELSKDLTNKPDPSKRLALQRIQGMDERTRAQIQRSAIGLARAMQYGLDRYPAIVFDNQAVVYGFTDLNVALMYYQAWRTGDNP